MVKIQKKDLRQKQKKEENFGKLFHMKSWNNFFFET